MTYSRVAKLAVLVAILCKSSADIHIFNHPSLISLKQFLGSPPAARNDKVHVGVGQAVSEQLFNTLRTVKNRKTVTGISNNMWETMWNRHLREQKRPPWGQDASTVLESVLNCVWEDRSKMSVLDVGCGSGADSIQLHKSGFGRVVGLDISPTAILLAQENFVNITADPQYGNPRGDLQLQNADFFKYGKEVAFSAANGNQFDVVWDRGLFHNLDTHERGRYAIAVSRVLAPGGHLFMMTGIQRGERQFNCPVYMPGVTKTALSEIGEDGILDVLNVTEVVSALWF